MADLLVKDHAELDLLLRDLPAEFDGGGAGDVPAKLDRAWARLAVHIRAEHLHLFPALLKAADEKREGATASRPTTEEVRASLERLRADHDFFMRELAVCVNTLRALAARGGSPDERLPAVKGRLVAVRERLAEHNRLEEEGVYLWRRALLKADERKALMSALRREIENLPPRFNADAP